MERQVSRPCLRSRRSGVEGLMSTSLRLIPLTVILITLSAPYVSSRVHHKEDEVTSTIPNQDSTAIMADLSSLQGVNALDLDPFFSKWSPWSHCSRHCKQKRVRRCKKSDICGKRVLKERRFCYRPDSKCKLDHRTRKGISRRIEEIVFDLLYHDWTEWSACTRSCKKRRIRTCALNRWCKNTVLLEEEVCIIPGTICESDDFDLQTDFESGESETSRKKDGHKSSSKKQKTNQERKDSSRQPVDPPDATVCGTREVAGSLRIVGGHEARRGSWPWIVAITTKRQEQYCGGALIAPQWVLTAAHCIRKNGRKRRVLVRVGEYDLAADEGPEVDIKVAKDFVHPNFNMDTIDSDIALLKLRQPVKAGKYINYACVPEAMDQRPVSTMCYAVGWGKMRETHLFGTDVLREAAVPLMSDQKCQDAFDYDITKNQMCAGYRKGGVDTCAGDSGGPLMCEIRKHGEKRWFVYGVTSFGEGCGDRGKYGIYTKVYNYSGWIANITRLNP